MTDWLKSLLSRPATVTQAHVAKLRSERTRTWTNPDFKAPRDSNWELMAAERYEDASAQYLKLAKESTYPAPYWRNRATALLALQRYTDAHDAYAEADQIESARNPQHHRDLASMGICLWLAGRRQDALALIAENLELRMKNKLTYGDAAGGAWEGLVAYFAGATLADNGIMTKAMKQLKKIATLKRRRGWPRPIAAHLVNAGSFEEMLLEAAEATKLETAIEHARVDTLSARHLSEALFYAGAKHRADGDEQACIDLMAIVAALPIVHGALEQHLARQEFSARASQ